MAEKNNITQSEVAVLLAHSVTLVREGMASLLKKAGFGVVADVDNDANLFRMTVRLNPNVLLLDWYFAKGPLEIIGQLARQNIFKGAVALVGHPNSPHHIAEAIQAGARGCLSLDMSGDEFVSKLHLLAQGDLVVSRDLTPALTSYWCAEVLPESAESLSEREREVVVLVSAGATNKEIAEELFLAENTVKVHMRHILEKLDLRNRQQVAAYAIRQGLVLDAGRLDKEETVAIMAPRHAMRAKTRERKPAMLGAA